MKDLTELKSYDALRRAAEILGVHLPVIFTPVEENYIAGKYGGIGLGVIAECRVLLYSAEIGQDKEWTTEQILDRMVGSMSDKSRSEALSIIRELDGKDQ